MKIGGMGYAILRVTAEQLRELHTIPKEVTFVATLLGGPNVWRSESTVRPEYWYDEHPFYFRIQHRYLPRVHDHGPLVIFTFHDLQRQMRDCEAQEKENHGKPVPPGTYGPWINDNE